MVWNHFKFGLIDPNQFLKRGAFLTIAFISPFTISHYLLNPVKRKTSEDEIITDRRDIRIAPNSSLKMRIEYDNSLRHREDFTEKGDLGEDALGIERKWMNEKQQGEDLLVVFVGDMWSTTDMYRPLRDEIMRKFKDYKVHSIAIQRFGYGLNTSKWFSYVKSMPNHSKLIEKAIEHAYSNNVVKEKLPFEDVSNLSQNKSNENLQDIKSSVSIRPRGSRTSVPSLQETNLDDSDFSVDREFSQYGREDSKNKRRRILFVGHGLGAYLVRGYIHGVSLGTQDQVAAVLIDPLTEFHGDSMEWKNSEVDTKLKFAYTNYAYYGLMEWLTSQRIPLNSHIKIKMLNHFSEFPESIQNAIKYATCEPKFWKTGFEELESYNLMTRKFIPKKMTNIYEGYKYSGVIIKADQTKDCDRDHWNNIDEESYELIANQEFTSPENSIIHISDRNHYNILYSLGLVNVISSKIEEFFTINKESKENI